MPAIVESMYPHLSLQRRGAHGCGRLHGEEVLEGKLVGIEDGSYIANGFVDPAFEVGIDAGENFPLIVSGHFAQFEIAPTLILESK